MGSDANGDHIFRPLFGFQNLALQVGDTVEYKDGDFLRITSVTEKSGRGLRFRRTSQLGGLFEGHLNEVALLLKYEKVDNTETLSYSQIVRARKSVMTNLQHPFLNSDTGLDRSWEFNHGKLICRWKLLCHEKDEGILQPLTKGDCDDEFGVDEKALKYGFRDDSIDGGSCPSWLPGELEHNIRERERCCYNDPFNFHPDFEIYEPPFRSAQPQTDDKLKGKTQRYTFGDGFCGAGGVSRGAKGAGLRIVWGFDFSPPAIESYVQNFAGTHCWMIAAHELLTIIKDDLKVDILHLSPPCQTFSPAHTRPGKDDEKNEATFFATRELIGRARPRIVTLEETFGLVRTAENRVWFHAMIRMFTCLGFGVRWKTFDLRDFGLPQPRRRLFLYAAW